MVDDLLRADCEGSEIASHIGINPATLYRACQREKKVHFVEYMREKKESGNALLKMKQYESAINDKNISMQIWLGKQRLGQRDKQSTEVTGKDGKDLIPEQITEIKIHTIKTDGNS